MSTAWIIVCLCTFLIGVTKSGFGAGVGLMLVPLTTLAMGHTPYGSKAALGLMLPLLILGDFLAVFQYRRIFSLDIVKHLLPGTFVGIVVGGLMLWWFHQHELKLVERLIRIEVGCESVLLVALHWWREYRGVQKNLMPEPWRSHLTGAFVGVSSTLAHAAGPIASMYLLPLKLDRQLFVGTCAIYFAIVNTAKLPAYGFSNMWDATGVFFFARFVPLVIAGAMFGLWINRKLSDKAFTRFVYATTFILGWWLLFDTISKWTAN